MKNTLATILGILILQLFTFVLHADETGYEVELIIFEDTTARYLQSEGWSYNDMLNNKKEEQTVKTKVDLEYKQLDWENAKLTSSLDRLKSNSNFRILDARRWKQTGLDREHAFNIEIGQPEPVENQQLDKNNEANSSVETPFEPQLDVPAHLKGSVKLIMSRYLHFNVDLQYIRSQRNDNGDMTQQIFPIVDERRMRSREIHYIDHPLVGIIVLVTPYKIKTADENTKPSEYKTM